MFKAPSFCMRYQTSLLIFTLVLSLIGGYTSPLRAASPEEERVAKLIEGAKIEGKLVIYTNTPVPSFDPLMKRFVEKYPFIKPEPYRLNAPRLLNRVQSEFQAGHYMVDCIETEGITAHLMMKQGTFMKYVSPESKTFPKEAKDPEGYWTSTYSNFKIIAYNTRLVSPKDVPKTWDDLLQPRWKGKMLLASNNYEWFGNMVKIMGQEKGMAFMRRLAQQNIRLTGGSTLTITLTIAGDGHIAIAANDDVMGELQAKGAPLDWVGADPIVSRVHPIAISRNPPHPNAAKLYIDFTLSKEGQEIVGRTRTPDRPDARPFVHQLADRTKIHAADLTLADTYEEFRKTFDGLFRKK